MEQKKHKYLSKEIEEARRLQKLIVAWFWIFALICLIALMIAWTGCEIVYMISRL